MEWQACSHGDRVGWLGVCHMSETHRGSGTDPPPWLWALTVSQDPLLMLHLGDDPGQGSTCRRVWGGTRAHLQMSPLPQGELG